ncbi:unnamed protein product [Caretta caretta]
MKRHTRTGAPSAPDSGYLDCRSCSEQKGERQNHFTRSVQQFLTPPYSSNNPLEDCLPETNLPTLTARLRVIDDYLETTVHIIQYLLRNYFNLQMKILVVGLG